MCVCVRARAWVCVGVRGGAWVCVRTRARACVCVAILSLRTLSRISLILSIAQLLR